MNLEQTVVLVDADLDADRSHLTEYGAISYRLPFRLRFPTPTLLSYRWFRAEYSLLLYNTLQFDDAGDEDQLHRALNRIHDWHFRKGQFCPFSLWTDVLLIFRLNRRKPSLASSIAATPDGACLEKDFSLDPDEFERVVHSLNQVLIAYVEETGLHTGGQRIRLLSVDDIVLSDSRAYLVVTTSNEAFTSDALQEVLTSQVKPILTHGFPGQLVGQFEDLPAATVDNVKSQIRRQENYLHYELAFKARYNLLSRDYESALLNAAIAFESVHNTFVREALCARLISDGIDAKGASVIANDYVRYLGIARSSTLTPYLFFPRGELPSSQEQERCQNAITLRNRVVHGDAKGGRRKDRRFARDELNDAASTLLRMYQTYADRLEDL